MRRSLAAALVTLFIVVFAQSCSSHGDDPINSATEQLTGGCGGIALTAYTDSTATVQSVGAIQSFLIPASVNVALLFTPGPSSGTLMSAQVGFTNAKVTCTYSRTAAGNASDYDPLPFTSCTNSAVPGTPITEVTSVSLYFAVTGVGEITASAVIPFNLDDGNLCTTDSCSNGTPQHQTITNTPVAGSDLCTHGVWYCDGSGTLQKPIVAAPVDSDPCVTTTCTPYVGWHSTPIAGCGVPAGGAPGYTGGGTVPSDIGNGMAFLYTASSPTQTGCNPGPCSSSIVTQHIAIIRGHVVKRDSLSTNIGGATVTIVNHPEFGSTVTRSDGWFDIAVNGGAPYVVQIVASGYMTVQRNAQTRWLDWTVIPDVALVAPEINPTTTCPAVTLGGGGWQCVQGLPHSDLDATRTATILVPPSTTISSCVGTTNCTGGLWQGGNSVTMHATEFTVGDAGRSALPGDLPPQSAYTYAVEAGITQAGDTRVNFSQPVFFYLENFTHAPDASNPQVPSGSYDRTRGVWQPEQTGKVYCIRDTVGGTAQMSIDNCATEMAKNGSGDYNGESPSITFGERQKLAAVYSGATNKQVWRVAMGHFSSWDLNWVLLSAIGPVLLPAADPTVGAPVPDPDCMHRSIIECQNQVLGEDLPLYGTPYSLHYRSESQNGYRPTITVPITENPSGGFGSLSQIQVEIQVAGQDHDLIVNTPFQPNQTISWSWDRKDAYGRQVSGQVTATVILTYIFTAPSFTYYGLTNNFAVYGASNAFNTGSRLENQLVVRKPYYVSVGGIDDAALGFGGWTLSDAHVYEPQSHALWMGTGQKRVPGRNGSDFISTYYYDGSDPGDIEALTAAADGTVYAAHTGGIGGGNSTQYYLAKLPSNGTPPLTVLSYTADSNHSAFTSGVTQLAQVGLSEGLECVVAGANQTLYTCNDNRIVAAGPPPTYVATLVAGAMNDVIGTTSDGTLAAGNSLHNITAIAFGPDGTLFFGESDPVGAAWLRFISGDGKLHTVAGNGTRGAPASGGLALSQPLNTVTGLAVGNDGRIYVADANDGHVWAIGKDGIITNYAGGGSAINDNGPATNASIGSPDTLSLVNGNLLIVANNQWRVRQVNPAGTITTVAGTGTEPLANGTLLVDNTIATLGTIGPWYGTANPDGWYYINDRLVSRVRRFGAIGDPVVAGTTDVLSPNGGSVFKFDSTGRHNATVSQYGAATQRTLTYDPTSNQLTSIADEAGNTTTVARSSASNPCAVAGTVMSITAPHGQVTTLGLDSNGYLSSFTTPACETTHLTHSSTQLGLLTVLTDAKSQTHNFTYDASGLLINDKTPPASPGVSMTRLTPGNGWSVALATEQSRNTNYSISTAPNSSSPTQIEQRVTTDPAGLVTTDTRYSDGSKSVKTPDGTTITTFFASDPRFGFGAPYVSELLQTTGSHSGSTGTVCTTGWNGNCALSSRTVTTTNSADPLATTSITDAKWGSFNGYDSLNSSRTTWSATGNTITYITPVGRQVVYSLDSSERLTQISFPGSDPVQLAPITFTYGIDTSGQGQVEQVQQGPVAGIYHTTTVQYAANGFARTVQTPVLYPTPVQYLSRDLDGRVLRATLPPTRNVIMTYDLNGNLSSLKTPNNSLNSFSSTSLDLLGSYQPASPGTGYWNTTYDYDLDGLLVDISPPNANPVAYTRDVAGRVIQTTYESQATSEFISITSAYDTSTGHLTKQVATNGTATGVGTVTSTYLYDGMLKSSEETTLSSPVAFDHTIHWSYTSALQANERYIDSTSSFTETKLNYDNDGLVSTTVTAPAVTIGPLGSTVTYDVYRAGSGNAGLLKCTNIGNVCTILSYDGFGQVTGEKSYGSACNSSCTGSGTVLLDLEYTRGTPTSPRLTQKQETTPTSMCTWTYGYDTTEQFLKTSGRSGGTYCNTLTFAPTFDNDGNIKTGPYNGTYDAQDRITTDGFWTYGYDAAGNLASWHDASNNFYYTYYDPFGNLRRWRTTVNLPTPIDYDIDAQNRRVGKVKAGSFVDGYLYDGQRMIAHVNSTGAVDTYFVYVTKENVPDLIVVPGHVYRALSDNLGTIVRMIDSVSFFSNGDYSYDALGNIQTWPTVLAAPPPPSIPFGFAGGIWDYDVQFYRFGARDYNPRLGRWVSQDPELYEGGMNLYQYCQGDPANCTDPTGEGPFNFLWCFYGQHKSFWECLPTIFTPDPFPLGPLDSLCLKFPQLCFQTEPDDCAQSCGCEKRKKKKKKDQSCRCYCIDEGFAPDLQGRVDSPAACDAICTVKPSKSPNWVFQKGECQ